MVRLAPFLALVTVACSAEAPPAQIDSHAVRPVSRSILVTVRPDPSTTRLVSRLEPEDVPSLENLSGFRPAGFSNIALVSTLALNSTTGDRTSVLYLRIFDADRPIVPGQPDYLFYPIAERAEAWDLRELSADRIVIAVAHIDQRADYTNPRTFIVSFGGPTSDGDRGFYPAPAAVEISEATTPLSL